MKYEVKLLILLTFLVVFPCIILVAFALQALWGQKNLIEKKITESYKSVIYNAKRDILENFYQKIKNIDKKIENYLQNNKNSIKDIKISKNIFKISKDNINLVQDIFVLNKKYKIIYPQLRPIGGKKKDSDIFNNIIPLENYHLFEKAYYYEFQKKDFKKAIEEYQKIVAKVQDQKLEYLGYALESIARCNLKNGEFQKALDTYKYLATIFKDNHDYISLKFMLSTLYQIALILKKQGKIYEFYKKLLNLLDYLYYNEFCIEKKDFLFYKEKILKEFKNIDYYKKLSINQKNIILKLEKEILKKYEKIRNIEKKVYIIKEKVIFNLKSKKKTTNISLLNLKINYI